MTITLPYNFEPRPYQEKFFARMNQGCKRAVLVHHRRAGKDICSWNYLIYTAVEKVGIYYYVFPTFAQGRKVLWDGMTSDGRKFMDYLPKALIKSTHQQEMKIRLTNGSLIQIVGSDNYDALMGTNPTGCIFSEYSLQDPNAWQYIRPILDINGGWAIFVFCVSPETIVFTEDGPRKICNISQSRQEFSQLNKKIYGLKGFHNATDFYYGGKKKLLKITSKKGYQIRCTPNHPIWDGNKWIESKDFKIGDILPIQRGQEVWSKKDFTASDWKRPVQGRQGVKKILPDNFLTLDMFYLMGLYLADGSGVKIGRTIIITKQDKSVSEFLIGLGFSTSDGLHHHFSCTELCDFFNWFGLNGTAKEKLIPDKLFECSRAQVIAFFQGYFDGDGNSGKKKSGYIKVCSVSKELIRVLQVLLLNFGIISRRSKYLVPPTKKVKVSSLIWNLEIEGHSAYLYYSKIGFRGKKQENIGWLSNRVKCGYGDIVPIDVSKLEGYFISKAKVTNPKKMNYRTIYDLNSRRTHPYLQKILSDNYFFDEIDSIEEDEDEVFDFVIPETHSFFSNGFISHNTPRGSNHAKELYDMAMANPDWFCQKLSILDTKILSMQDIAKIREEGMSEDMIQQEFFCSFSLGIMGSYYSKYLDEAKQDGRICSVPWDRQQLVHTAWDIGIGDSTAIVFFQLAGKEIHVIDYYETNGEGLPHYISLLKSKKYLYGSHFAPHDIKAREFTTGHSRLEVAAQLGINFTVLKTLDWTIDEGIEAVRGIFPRLWIDEKACKQVVLALENYRKEYDEKNKVYKSKPKHDQWSHCCVVADTKISMKDGKKRIDEIVVGDEVLTPNGYKKVINIFEYEADQLNFIETSNSSITCTPNHKIFSEDGLIYSDAIRYNTVVFNQKNIEECRKRFGSNSKTETTGFRESFLLAKMKNQSYSTVDFSDGMENITEEIHKKKENLPCIKKFIPITKVMYQPGCISITSTETLKTMIFQICRQFQFQSISECTCLLQSASRNLENKYTKLWNMLRYGTLVRKEENGTENTQKNAALEQSNCQWSVSNVKKSSREKHTTRNIAAVDAKPNLDMLLEKITRIGFVQYVLQNILQINIHSKERVLKNVPLRLQMPQKVYDIEVENDHCYYANEILVSNSDSIRYMAIGVQTTLTSSRGVSDDEARRMFEKYNPRFD